MLIPNSPTAVLGVSTLDPLQSLADILSAALAQWHAEWSKLIAWLSQPRKPLLPIRSSFNTDGLYSCVHSLDHMGHHIHASHHHPHAVGIRSSWSRSRFVHERRVRMICYDMLTGESCQALSRPYGNHACTGLSPLRVVYLRL